MSITTFDEPKKDVAVGVINSKVKRFKDNEKEKVSNEEAGNKDNAREMDAGDNNSKQSSKRRKYSEKSLVTDESDIKVKRKKKEASDQNITDQQDERRKAPKPEFEDKDNTHDNETDATDNNGRQSSKKRKHSSDKLLVTHSDNETDTINNTRQSIKKGKYAPEKLLDENDIKIKKKRKAADQDTTYEQNEKEKVLKEDSEDKNNAYDNEINTADNNSRQSLKKKKLTPEKSCSRDERDIKVTGNSNIENQETSNKNRNKITEKRKRRLTINDTIVAKDVSGEVVKEECQEPATNSNINESTEIEYSYEGDESNETNALLHTEKHSTSDFGMRNSDVEETSFDERKKKKNRKKRSKVQNNDICIKIGLQIMAKPDWKRLRNRYLDLQRHKMSQLKVHLRKAEVERDGIMTKNGYHDKTGSNNIPHDKSKYENDDETLEEKTSSGRVNYAPGIIVKIDMDEPCADLQSFKVH